MSIFKQNEVHNILLFFPLLALFFTSKSLMDGWMTGSFFYLCFITGTIFIIISVIGIIFSKSIFIRIHVMDISLLLLLIWCAIQVVVREQGIFMDVFFIQWVLLTGLYGVWKQVFQKMVKNEYSDDPSRVGDSFLLTHPKNEPSKKIFFPLLLTFFLGIGIVEAIYGLGQLYGLFSTGIFFKITGHFANSDHYAGYIASITPFAFGLFYLNHNYSSEDQVIRWLMFIGLVTFLLCILVLPATMIRGAWLAAATGIGFVMVHKHNNWIKTKLLTSMGRKSAVFGFALLVSGIAFTGLYHLKPDSADGRLLIWKIAGQTIKEAPFIGHGFNTYQVKHNRRQAAYFKEEFEKKGHQLVDLSDSFARQIHLAGNVEHAHNEFLQIHSELGLVGLLLFSSLLFFGFRSPEDMGSHSSKMQNKFSFVQILQICARGSLLAILVSSLFSFPLHILPIFIHFFFFLAMISALKDRNSGKVVNLGGSKKGYMAVYFLLVISSVWFLWMIRGQMQAYKIWNESYLMAQMGLHEHAAVNYEPIVQQLKWNGKFMFTYGGILAATERYEEARPILERSELIYANPNLFLALGETYQGLGDTDLAIKYYLLSWYIIPHRIYPLYRVVLLQLESGNIKEATFWAEMIVGIEVKVPSSATQQIKAEMEEFLQEV